MFPAMNGSRCFAALVFLTLGALSACSHSGEKASPAAGDPEERSAVAIVGRIRWEGAPPKPRIFDVSSCPTCREANPHGVPSEDVLVDPAGNLANVVVYIDNVPEDHAGVDGSRRPTAFLDATAKGFRPHVLAVQVGQQVSARNRESEMYCVHWTSRFNGDWNTTLRGKTARPFVVPPSRAELGARIKCDIHVWKRAVGAVFEHPYFAVSDPDGTFRIDTAGLPAGDYEVRAWHEKYKHAPAQRVTVAAEKAPPLQFSFRKKKRK